MDPDPKGSASFWLPGYAFGSASNKNPDPFASKFINGSGTGSIYRCQAKMYGI
jgi:hypothetical protein